jgi:hypothetical protein
MITAVMVELLKYMAKSRDCWFTTHEALADWALKQNVDEHTYQSRYFNRTPTSRGGARRIMS